MRSCFADQVEAITVDFLKHKHLWPDCVDEVPVPVSLFNKTV